MAQVSSANEWILEKAREAGFALCGVVRPQAFPELEQFGEWLERGYHGEMKYLEDARRREREHGFAGAKSAIVCGMNYNTAHATSVEAAAERSEEPRGWISRYAWGKDYHEILWARLNGLAEKLKERFGAGMEAKSYADTGPVPERVLAKYAGLGWIGKNTLLIREGVGSWVFLGVILTTLELQPSVGEKNELAVDLCGNCRQCLDACPTEALIEPYVMDARKCISYLTIELRGSIPKELREKIGWQVYGCDICQDVCPYNRAAVVNEVAEFEPRRWNEGESLERPRLEWLASMSEQKFREVFRGSAMKRTKWRGLVRNACVALGNARLQREKKEHQGAIRILEELSGSADEVIAESARWACQRIQ